MKKKSVSAVVKLVKTPGVFNVTAEKDGTLVLKRTGLNKEKLSELMDKESWFSANEAKEYGFINEIIENTDIETVNNKVLSNGMVFNMAGFNNFKVDKLAKNINNKIRINIVILIILNINPPF